MNANQHNINQAYTSWSNNHAERYKHVSTLKYRPWLFPDQNIGKAYRPINRLSVWLPETAYLKGLETVFAKAVGSRALAETIIASFEAAPSSPHEAQSLTDYAIENLEEGRSFGVATGHLDRLTDVAELTQGLSLSVARREGRKFLPNFRVVINHNMTREKFFGIPAPWLSNVGLGVYWGSPPGESARKHGLSEEAGNEINLKLSQQFIKDKKKGAIALGFVPSFGGLDEIVNPLSGEIVGYEFRDSSYSAGFIGHCEGGVIPANRYGDSVMLGSVIRTTGPRPKGISKGDFNRRLADQVTQELAVQASELIGNGIPVHYKGFTAIGGVAMKVVQEID